MRMPCTVGTGKVSAFESALEFALKATFKSASAQDAVQRCTSAVLAKRQA